MPELASFKSQLLLQLSVTDNESMFLSLALHLSLKVNTFTTRSGDSIISV